MILYGAVEIGGTNLRLAVGSAPGDLEPVVVATGEPDETVDEVASFFAERPVAAVGVACFGPLDLEPSSGQYGSLLATPKAGWSYAPILRMLRERIEAPIALDTDVNGAALGEGRWGAAQGMSDFAYVTVGTGIGVGVMAGGSLIGPRHPEAGHVVVTRVPEDDYSGRCPYHGDCLEGMASGPALEDRFGPPERWAGNEEVLRVVSGYLSQGLRDLVYTVGPERIVVGGGVSRLPAFHARLRHDLDGQMAGYPSDPDLDLLVSPPGLGDRSALAGGLSLAERLSRSTRDPLPPM